MGESGLNFDRDVHPGWQVELFELIDGLGDGFNDINQAFVSSLFESFLGFFVRMRRAQNGETFHTGWQRDGACNTGAGAFYGVGDVAGGLVNDAMVKGLEANTNALSSHTKNNCLLM